jgi:hypothetical protein
MGWGRTFLLGDIGNRLDIEDVELEVRNIQREIEETFRKDVSQDEILARLMRENGELKLYLASLIRILMLKGSITRDEFESVVAAIDSEDGSADGKFSGDIV